MNTSWPAPASARATARPTTPAPMTMQSTSCNGSLACHLQGGNRRQKLIHVGSRCREGGDEPNRHSALCNEILPTIKMETLRLQTGGDSFGDFEKQFVRVHLPQQTHCCHAFEAFRHARCHRVRVARVVEPQIVP